MCWAGLGWAVLGWVVMGWAGLCMDVLGCAGMGWAGLGRACSVEKIEIFRDRYCCVCIVCIDNLNIS